AYQAAAKYLKSGLEAAGPNPNERWERDYDLTFALTAESAECEHLSGRFAVAEELFDALSARARTRIERLRVQTLRLILAITLSRFPEAIAACAAGAAQFGIVIPETHEA